MLHQTYQQEGRSRVLDNFRSSIGPMLLALTGPADSGKSVLLDDLGAFDSERDRRVVRIAGRRVDRRPEVIVSNGPAQLTAAELMAVAAEGNVTLLVDDAQWLAEDFAQAVSVLAEGRSETELRLAVAFRDTPLQPTLASLADGAAADSSYVTLGPLPESEVEQWVAGADDEAAEVHLATGGWAGLVAHQLDDGDTDRVVEARLGLLTPAARTVIDGLAWGIPTGTDLLTQITGLTPGGIDTALDEIALAGLLHRTPEPVPAIGEAIRNRTPQAARLQVAQAAAEGTHRDPRFVASELCAMGDNSDAALDLYASVGAQLTPTAPSEALTWFERAGNAHQYDTARARAFLYVGRSAEAAKLATSAAGPEAAAIAAAAWAHEGLAGDSADIEPGASGPQDEMAAAIKSWLTGDEQGALDQLAVAARKLEVTGDATLWSDTPHATGALLASQLLDWGRAERFLAGSSGIGGRPFERRHTLVGAWISLRRGRFSDVQAALDEVGEEDLTTRDALLASAVSLGLLVRADTPGQIPEQAGTALELQRVAAVTAVNLEIHGEIAVGLGKWQGATAGAALVADLNKVVLEHDWPPAARRVTARSETLVGLVGDDPELASRWSEPGDELFGSLTLKLSEAYDGRADPDAVSQLVEQLQAAGLPFEASRLAGIAALHTTDPQAARKLLRLSRDLREVRKRAPATVPQGTDVIALSARELDVAKEMLTGLTQKQIGEALFISPKTVEHHVAHIRQKLGSQSRSETMALLREYLDNIEG